jgi:hypothetical protein
MLLAKTVDSISIGLKIRTIILSYNYSGCSWTFFSEEGLVSNHPSPSFPARPQDTASVPGNISIY